MIVENGEPNVPELGMGIGVANSNPEGVVLTQVEVLRSVGMIKEVVERLGLVSRADLRGTIHWPGYLQSIWDSLSPLISRLPRWPMTTEAMTIGRTVEYMQQHLRVMSEERSSVITLEYPAGSSELATAIVNALMQAYLDNDIERRALQIKQVNAWLAERAARLEMETEEADRQVMQFVESHPQLAEVASSLPAAIQLNAQQTKLADAQQELARQRALYETISRGAASDEVLNSKTIEMYKDREAQLLQQQATLGPLDPRRGSFQSALNRIQAEKLAEKAQIALAISRNLVIAKLNVSALETAIQDAAKGEHRSSADAATLASLRAKAQEKKQIALAFGTRGEQTRLAAAQLPSSRVLYHGFALPRHSVAVPSVIIGWLAGALLVGGIIVLRDALQNRVIAPSQLVSATGLPVLASLPEVDWRRKPVPQLVTETVRAMWWNVLSNPSKGVVVTITSSETGEGKTTLTAIMSRRIAADGGRVLVIDADLRRRGLGAAFSTSPKVPIEAVLRGEVPMSDAICRDVSGVNCFLPDASVDNPISVFQSAAFRQLIETSRSTYDVVFLDTPPVLRVADALFLSKLADHILFVVRAGRASTDLVSGALARFPPEERSKVITVLTRVSRSNLRTGDLYMGYETA
jgi:capsular exopolysaccharide synthesis family protein